MSTLWTPGGERPVGREPAAASPPPQPAGPAEAYDGPEAEMSEQEMRELQAQLAAAPVELVIANHCYGLFELAALHLGQQPPQLDQARLAIDAMGAVVDGLAGRLGEPEEQLKDGLAQLKMAYVQLQAAGPPSGG